MNFLNTIDKLLPSSPNYWCTQSACLLAVREALMPQFAGDQAKPGVRDAINEEAIFGNGGWAEFFPESRSDLFFLLDDGWDVLDHSVR